MNDSVICFSCHKQVTKHPAPNWNDADWMLVQYSYGPAGSRFANQIICAECYLREVRTEPVRLGPSEIK